MWLPGVKYKCLEARGDIDLVACCDGALVFGECKDLSATSADAPVWDSAIAQFKVTCGIASRCGADLVVFATLAKTISPDVAERLRNCADGKIPVLLLGGADLEGGRREILRGGSADFLTLSDLLSRSQTVEQDQRGTGERVIECGMFRSTR